MLPLIRRPIGPGGRRRGVTLVEMLVVVALVVLMMVILVQIFQVATGAISASRTIQELDVTLRQADSIIRSDLAGVTAKMTPPNNPTDKRGYFVYGENAPADLQGEDTDDYLAFTTRAPEGQTFSGRQWLPTPANNRIQPTTINSQVAEVIYFLRNGNLYRRVFLVAPDRVQSIQAPASQNSAVGYGNYYTPIFGGFTHVSWLGMNDISCRPAGVNGAGIAIYNPIPNDLGTLTNRENRAFSPRFFNDFSGTASGLADSIADDNNGDGIPDYYPTLNTDGTNHNGAPNTFVNDKVAFPSGEVRKLPGSRNIYAFPFIYPGMYSVPDPNRRNVLGWVHSLIPGTNSTTSQLQVNHSPLLVGDNVASPAGYQTWFGFPTWRETMTGQQSTTQLGWTDPIYSLNSNSLNNYSQANGLIPFDPTQTPNPSSPTFPPPVTNVETGDYAPFTTDGTSANPVAGSTTFVAIPAAPQRVWEDDLLLTGVRSFDVKAYDLNAPLYNITTSPQVAYFSAGYQDLGYGSSHYNATYSTKDDNGIPNYVAGPNGFNGSLTSQVGVPWQAIGGEPVGFGHEGRIPPNPQDFRIHPRRPQLLVTTPTGTSLIPYNIGDSSPGVIRLTRVWDSWSTDYVNAPDFDLFLNNYSTLTPAIYPSFPAPYPSPLRGIQVQIRLGNARGDKAKSITIRVDFTDKL